VSPDAVVVVREAGHGALDFGVTLEVPGLLVRREADVLFLAWLLATETKMVRSNSAMVIELFGLFINAFHLLTGVKAYAASRGPFDMQ
jgi:hypothetical protein